MIPALAGVVLVLLAVGPAAAQVTLKDAVVLLGANAGNETLALPANAGALEQDLYFHVGRALTGPGDKQPLHDPSGELIALPLQATTAPADVAAITLSGAGSKAPPSAGPISIPLTLASLQRVTLRSTPLRPSAIYKGFIVLRSADQDHRWEVTVTTGGRGVMKVVPIGPLQFTATPPFGTMGQFVVTLRNQSDLGPYRNLHAYFESGSPAPSKTIRSNLVTSVFSFFDDAAATMPLNLDRDGSGAGLTRDRQVHVRVGRLAPGDYSGALRFTADEAIEGTDDTRLPLVIHVRHHWIFPVTVLFVGSLIGWFSTKYIVAVNKARDLSRQIAVLRARVEHVARNEEAPEGWTFPSEASSLAVARIRVGLSQLGYLATSPIMMLTREAEITEQRREVELRLGKIELFQNVRLSVQRAAHRKPSAQAGIGGRLRRALTEIEGPVLDDAHIAEFALLLEELKAWAASATFATEYRRILLERRGTLIPTPDEVKNVKSEPLRSRLNELIGKLPAEGVFADAPVDTLEKHDQEIGEIMLLWIEREYPWADELGRVCASGATLEKLFGFVDRQFWDYLKHQRFDIETTTGDSQPKAFTLVEARLTTAAPGVTPARMRRHPLRIIWQIEPEAEGPRAVQSDGLTLVQYFLSPGAVKISATLRFAGEDIPVRADPPVQITLTTPLTIALNADYQKRRFFLGFAEWAPLLIATGFATATAMNAQYDSTFGSLGQYLALFIWAAGAATGGNMFKQLGTTQAPGGSAESALPPR